MLPSNANLGTIMNCDHGMLLIASSADQTTPDEYSGLVGDMLDAHPGVFALRVGNPDSVLYDTAVATSMDKHHMEVCLNAFLTDPGTGKKWMDEAYIRGLHGKLGAALGRLIELGADPLALAAEAGKQRGVPVMASYRMNGEDNYDYTWMLSDFGRAHPDCRIPLTPQEIATLPEGCRQKQWTGALDPAREEVYEHRMSIFREVAEKYDIAGIEFDFMRWNHMISDPLENHPILTKMVADTRRVLDEAAKRKGRDRMLLGVRVPPSIRTPPEEADYPGMEHAHQNTSCRDKGLDVETWVANGHVDYVCPSLFWPQWPGKPHTAEFVALASGTNVGIYPTLFPKPPWLREPIGPEDRERLGRYKNEFCETALHFHDDNPDGLSTYNWHPSRPGAPARLDRVRDWGLGALNVQMIMHTKLGDRASIQTYLEQEEPLDSRS